MFSLRNYYNQQLSIILLFIVLGCQSNAQQQANQQQSIVNQETIVKNKSIIKRPFPQHTVYTKHTIKPTNHKTAEIDKVVTTFYERWKKAYIRNNCSDTSQYYVLDDEEMEAEDKFHSICVSEGQGYGMLITVIMAGYDSNAQTIFDGLYRFYKSHPSERSEYLMSWSILNECKTNKLDGNNSSASDGDFDIALSLLMASEQWGNEGTIHYKSEALKMIAAIQELEINPKMKTILMSNDNHPEIYAQDMHYYETHPSDYDYNDLRSS